MIEERILLKRRLLKMRILIWLMKGKERKEKGFRKRMGLRGKEKGVERFSHLKGKALTIFSSVLNFFENFIGFSFICV